jgi:hypothetical protein
MSRSGSGEQANMGGMPLMAGHSHSQLQSGSTNSAGVSRQQSTLTIASTVAPSTVGISIVEPPSRTNSAASSKDMTLVSQQAVRASKKQQPSSHSQNRSQHGDHAENRISNVSTQVGRDSRGGGRSEFKSNTQHPEEILDEEQGSNFSRASHRSMGMTSTTVVLGGGVGAANNQETSPRNSAPPDSIRPGMLATSGRKSSKNCIVM